MCPPLVMCNNMYQLRWNLAWKSTPWVHSRMQHLALIGRWAGAAAPKFENLVNWCTLRIRASGPVAYSSRCSRTVYTDISGNLKCNTQQDHSCMLWSVKDWVLEFPKLKIWWNSMVLWRYVTIKTEFGEEEYTIGMFSHMGVLQRGPVAQPKFWSSQNAFGPTNNWPVFLDVFQSPKS